MTSNSEAVGVSERARGGNHAYEPDADDWYCLKCGMPPAGHAARFGYLLNPTTPPTGTAGVATPSPDLKTRLLAMYSHRGDGIPTQHVNPDGPDAVARIKALEAQLATVDAAIRALGDKP